MTFVKIKTTHYDRSDQYCTVTRYDKEFNKVKVFGADKGSRVKGIEHITN